VEPVVAVVKPIGQAVAASAPAAESAAVTKKPIGAGIQVFCTMLIKYPATHEVTGGLPRAPIL
jgi:hypothetical protein